MFPDIMALVIIGVTVGLGMILIARQETASDRQDPSSTS